MNKEKIEEIITQKCTLLDKDTITLLNAGHFFRAQIAAALSGKDIPYEVLAAIEMAHSASIFHDDVLDNEESRRGKPSANTLLGNKHAILAGDLLLSYSTSLIANTGNLDLLHVFLESINDTCQGEIKQQLINKDNQLSFSNFYDSVSGKTGSFFGFAAYSGAYYANNGLNPETIKVIFTRLGALYQLYDDMKDSFFPNNSRSDLENDYITFPVVLLAKKINMNEFFAVSNQEKNEIFKKYHIQQECEQYIDKEFKQLIGEMKNLGIKKELLEVIYGVFNTKPSN